MAVSPSGGRFLREPIIRIMVFWALYWVPLILGNYQMAVEGVALWV